MASAEFLKTIYECNLGEREQDAPRVLMCSDPTFPDRSDTLLLGNRRELLDPLLGTLRLLRASGASPIVICCMTIHHLLPQIPAEVKQHVVSLVDVIVDAVITARNRHLLACTNGTRELGVFQSHEKWEQFKEYVVFPGDDDQQAIHRIIYQVKRNQDVRETASAFDAVLRKYEVDSFIAACTELHLIAKHLGCSRPGGRAHGCIDPLAIVAGQLAKGQL